MKDIFYAVLNDKNEVLNICETPNGASRFADKLDVSAITVPTFDGLADAKKMFKNGTPYKASRNGHFWAIAI